ncbi:MAG: redoxin domain-containing protein [Dehalococcoidia bacterium]|nr:redoxin domain-containing protein [Dehalococcoidia bacterium]
MSPDLTAHSRKVPLMPRWLAGWSGPHRLRAALATCVVAAALVACAPLPGLARVLGGSALGSSAPEFAGLGDWLNSDPRQLAALRAERRVVLVDFWTYTCVNCIRTLPYLKQWHERYAGVGLTIIGVHAPEFEFERERDNVRAAVEEHGIRYPVALDNDMRTWAAFRNHAWPAKYLVGVDGRIRYTHLGEGEYDATERAIRDALTAAGHDVAAIPAGGLPAPAFDPRVTTITRELYGGYERNYDTRGAYAAQAEYYRGADQTHDYLDTFGRGDQRGRRDHNVWYLQGRWRAEREAVVHARETRGLEDYVAFRFTARSVNAVMRSRAPGTPYDVIVELDGRPLGRDEAGRDVRPDPSGRSVVAVREPRMYSLAILPALGDHELKLSSDSPDFALYAVTFGAYTAGP